MADQRTHKIIGAAMEVHKEIDTPAVATHLMKNPLDLKILLMTFIKVLKREGVVH